MPKNKGKGGKRKRRGKKNVQTSNIKNLKIAGPNEKYGKVIALYGNCRITVETPEKVQYMCHIPGAFKKRVWINMDDIVLFQIRSFEPDKGDIISKYFPDEVKWLTRKKHIPGHFSGLQVNDENNQDIDWNLPEEDSDELPDDATPSEKERRKKQIEARDAVPAQDRTYDLPSFESSDAEEDEDLETMLMNL